MLLYRIAYAAQPNAAKCLLMDRQPNSIVRTATNQPTVQPLFAILRFYTFL